MRASAASTTRVGHAVNGAAVASVTAREDVALEVAPGVGMLTVCVWCVCVYMFVRVYMFLCAHACLCLCTCVCTCLYVCMFVCVRERACVCNFRVFLRAIKQTCG